MTVKEIVKKKFSILQRDICPNLHALNDFGYARDSLHPKDLYSRSRTYEVECWAEKDGEECGRKGQCIRVKIKKER
ncbi:MAG: hypothetical protein PHD04_03925 [Candidatus Pacebacteria bacterium]|nr:hypothetical protein [Candidatus Paceibacterota bacterium]